MLAKDIQVFSKNHLFEFWVCTSKRTYPRKTQYQLLISQTSMKPPPPHWPLSVLLLLVTGFLLSLCLVQGTIQQHPNWTKDIRQWRDWIHIFDSATSDSIVTVRIQLCLVFLSAVSNLPRKFYNFLVEWTATYISQLARLPLIINLNSHKLQTCEETDQIFCNGVQLC